MERESKGWIKLARKVINSWVWEDAARFKRWIALLLAVNFDTQTVDVNGGKICVCAGETLMTLRQLADVWECSKSSARNYLDTFQTEKLVKKEQIMVGKRVIYKIVVTNYQKYQGKSNDLKPTNGIARKLARTSAQKLAQNSARHNYDDNQSFKAKTFDSSVRKLERTSELKVDENLEPLKEIIKNKEVSSDELTSVQVSWLKSLLEFWNTKMQYKRIPCTKSISYKRLDMLKACNSIYGGNCIFTVISMVSESRFLDGYGKKHFTATFDWVFTPSNFVKIFEGNYNMRDP